MMADRLSLTGKIAIVTGGARGLGLAVTRGLLNAGAAVLALDLPDSKADMASLSAWAREAGLAPRLATHHTDVTDSEQCDAAVAEAVDRFGGLHCVVNNAGRLLPKPMKSYELSPAQWCGVVDVNLNGPFFMMRAAAGVLLKQRWGRIVNVVTSRTTLSKDGFGPYGPSKAGLEAATLLWAREFAGSGVTVNAVLPGGGVQTRLAEAVVTDVSKLMSPDVMVPPVQWLCSAQSDGITGMRYVGKDWDPTLLDAEAAKRAGEAAAWL
jgi:NAD(P)-dependent dehydrogenase (short-subunit alcohol dehydrogenase family)